MNELTLAGRELPPLKLDSTDGRVDLRELGRHLLVLFLYSHATGLPEPPVPNWDRIPGAPWLHRTVGALSRSPRRLVGLGAELAGEHEPLLRFIGRHLRS